MSILSKNNNENNSLFFREFKKQASFFLKEKIKTARLALTDVTPAELLTEEATSGNLWAPDTRTLASISRSAFDIDDYTRTVEILHKRLAKFEKKNWRVCYNSAIVLEHLLTHGPESVAEEFQCDRDVIREMEGFQYIDEKGFNWGLAAGKKSERVLKLLEKGPLLKEERDRARKVSRVIQGFGSFVQRSSSTQGILREQAPVKSLPYGRSNSQFNSHENQENQFPCPKADCLSAPKPEKIYKDAKRSESSGSDKPETSLKENMAPKEEEEEEELHGWNDDGESSSLLLESMDGELRLRTPSEDDHPFSDTTKQSTASLLC